MQIKLNILETKIIKKQHERKEIVMNCIKNMQVKLINNIKGNLSLFILSLEIEDATNRKKIMYHEYIYTTN